MSKIIPPKSRVEFKSAKWNLVFQFTDLPKFSVGDTVRQIWREYDSVHVGMKGWVFGQLCEQFPMEPKEFHVSKVWAFLTQAVSDVRCEYYYELKEIPNSRITERDLKGCTEGNGKADCFDFGRYANEDGNLFEHDIPCIGQAVQVVAETSKPVVDLNKMGIQELVGSGIDVIRGVYYTKPWELQQMTGEGSSTVSMLGNVEGIWISEDCFEYNLSYTFDYVSDDSFSPMKTIDGYNLCFDRAVLRQDRNSGDYSLMLSKEPVFANYERTEFICPECVETGTIQDVIVVGDVFKSNDPLIGKTRTYAVYKPACVEKGKVVTNTKKSNSF